VIALDMVLKRATQKVNTTLLPECGWPTAHFSESTRRKLDFIGSLKLVTNLSTTVLPVCVPLLFAEVKTVLKSYLNPSKKKNKFLVQECLIRVKFPQ
jgi:hypothetical protein